jgi:protein-tyrosine-phosphatase
VPFTGDALNLRPDAPMPEDEAFVAELHQRAKHAQDQRAFHAAEVAKFDRIASMCEAALSAPPLGDEQSADAHAERFERLAELEQRDAWVYTEERVQQRKAQ